MPERNILVVLAEIEQAMDGIENAAKGKSLDDFVNDWLLKRGIERGLEIISEACRHIPDEMLGLVPEIRWKQIRGIGNVFRHEYHKISEPIVWNVVKDDLPPLRQALRRIRNAIALRED